MWSPNRKLCSPEMENREVQHLAFNKQSPYHFWSNKDYQNACTL